MEESIVNLHMHTTYSDGTGSHRDIARAALQTGVDVAIVTDHNVLVDGPEGYYREGKNRVLMLIGEEVHNQARQPQKNHLLVFGARREMATYADDPQNLINLVRQSGGICFIAHPLDPECKPIKETDISWEDWAVHGYTGFELWNSLSEIKPYIKSKLHALFYALFPQFIAHGPFPEVLRRWDDLLNNGKRVNVVGGSDAHALHYHMGPLRRTVFPYAFHFRGINTHILTSKPLSGETETDRKLVLDALAAGHAFIGYDLPASTKGFHFTAQGREQTAIMGDEISAENGVTLQVRTPNRYAEIRLIHNGNMIQKWQGRQTYTHITTEPGVYRVEGYIRYLGLKRGWIFSNPIYVK
jgi:hypothetical protein